MENVLIDEEHDIYTKEVDNVTFIHYKPKYENENCMKIPAFKKWLDGEIKKAGKYSNDYNFTKCDNCNFFHFTDFYGKYVICCEKHHYLNVCRYCGSIFYEHSYCCIKLCLVEDFSEYLLNDFYSCNVCQSEGLFQCIKSLPLAFHLTFSGTFIYGLFLHRKGTDHEDITSSYIYKGTNLSELAKYIMYMLILIYTLVYFIPISILYFIYLLIFFNGYQHKHKNGIHRRIIDFDCC